MQFEWKAWTAQSESDSANKTTGVLDAAWGIFGTLIIDIIALVFIWMAFMAAKNVSKAVKMAVQPFEDIGNKVGSLAKSIPKYTPIPGTGLSAAGMTKVVSNAENAMIGAHDERFKSSAAGKLFGWDKVVATVDEKKLADAMKAVWMDPNKKADLKIVWEQIEKQTGKDIDHSSMFQTVADGLKNMKDRRDKITALENIGYSNKAAMEIVDQLGKKDFVVDKNDTTLMTALKSRVGAPAWWAASGAAGFTQQTLKDTNWKEETHITLGDIKLTVEKWGTLSQTNIDKLIKEWKDKWDEENFNKNISSFTQDVQNGLKKAIKDQTDFYKKTDTPTSPTPPAAH